MASPRSAQVEVEWVVHTLQVAGLSVPIARLRSWIYLPLEPPASGPPDDWAWIDTGAPLSVVPFRVQQKRLVWHPRPGVQMTWMGQPCALGEMDIWLPDVSSGSPRGPYRLLAKFPYRDPPGVTAPILLGLHFLLEHQADLTLPPPPSPGLLDFP